MKWEYFSLRRRISLDVFLEGLNSYAEAVRHFEQRAIALPEGDELRKKFPKKVPVKRTPPQVKAPTKKTVDNAKKPTDSKS